MSENQSKETINASFKEAGSSALVSGFGERNLQTYSVAILVPESLFGIGISLCTIFGALAELVGSVAPEKGFTRKSYFILSVLIQLSTWILMIASILTPGPYNVILFIIALNVFYTMLHTVIPPWTSWMGDVVQEGRMGEYSGRRNFIYGVGVILSSFASAFILDYSKSIGMLNIGFYSLFVFSVLFGITALFFISKMHDVTYRLEESDKIPLANFIKQIIKSDFGRFVIYKTAFTFGVCLAGSFFGYYMLKDLKWSFTEFMISVNVQVIVMFGSQPFWGKFADKYGNKIATSIGGFGVSLIPVLWLLSSNKCYLICVQAYDGIVWSAFVIGASNYVFDAVKPAQRARFTAYNNFITNLAAFAGTGLGGLLYELLPNDSILFGYKIHFTFYILLIISALFRFLPNLIFLPTFSEMRINKRKDSGSNAVEQSKN